MGVGVVAGVGVGVGRLLVEVHTILGKLMQPANPYRSRGASCGDHRVSSNKHWATIPNPYNA